MNLNEGELLERFLNWIAGRYTMLYGSWYDRELDEETDGFDIVMKYKDYLENDK